MYMVTPATEACMMAVGHFAKKFDPGKNGLRVTADSATRLKNEIATNDPNVVFSYTPCTTMTRRDLLRCVRSKCSCC